MMDIIRLRTKMQNPFTRQAAILEFADWSRDLVLGFGAEFDTAVLVGSAIARGLDKEVPVLRQAALGEIDSCHASEDV